MRTVSAATLLAMTLTLGIATDEGISDAADAA
jgi:hypothetical protein